jgi:hypothetical protein
MFHCHLEFHSEVGMSLLVKIGNKKDLPVLPKNWPDCGDFSFDDSGATLPLNKSSDLISDKILLIFVILAFLFMKFL